jgi:hypothetical protein
VAEKAKMRKRALVFAGAGASYAVDSNAYPTTVQFFNRLPDEIREHRLVKAIVQHLPAKFGEGPPDVEKILWCLEELYDYLAAVNDSKHPASWFLPNNELSGLVGTPHAVNVYVAAAHQGIKVTRDLRNAIAAKVYDFYSTTPSKESVLDNWQALFNFLSSSNYWLDAVTTNYDLVIEYASDYAGQPIHYGQGRGVVRALDVELWKRSLADSTYPLPQEGLLTKLHGSVNWLRENKKIIFGGTEFKGDHAYHGVIYPGFKGVPKEEPFSLMHSYFEEAIRRADLIIFVGFAFRDEYITTCLERNVGNKLITVIDPGNLHIPPTLEKNIRHIKNGFSAAAVAELSHVTQPSTQILKPQGIGV